MEWKNSLSIKKDKNVFFFSIKKLQDMLQDLIANLIFGESGPFVSIASISFPALAHKTAVKWEDWYDYFHYTEGEMKPGNGQELA